jgi:2-polyprenyl-3-methyl-5-hydroxy-6-metoxy-1,4-benzoquinol methylase
LGKNYDEELYKGSLNKGITLIKYDIEKENRLDFDSGRFDVVTMLALIEHLEITNIKSILEEIYRVLKPNGIYIMTTPAPWTAKILEIMASLKILSKQEIEGHKNYFYPRKISLLLQEAGFMDRHIKVRYFETLANMSVIAMKIKGNN